MPKKHFDILQGFVSEEDPIYFKFGGEEVELTTFNPCFFGFFDFDSMKRLKDCSSALFRSILL